MAGSGDIWGKADACQFAWSSFEGDGELVVRVLEIHSNDPWAKTGLMLRHSLAADSPQVSIFLTLSNGVSFQYRLAKGEDSAADTPFLRRTANSRTDSPERQSRSLALLPAQPVTVPCWLKLVRRGNLFSGYYSEDGTEWQWAGTQRVEMPDGLYGGLALSSRDALRRCLAILNSLEFANAPADEAPPVEPAGASAPGTGDGLKATFFEDIDLSGNTVSEILPIIDFNWTTNPAKGIEQERFSVRWEGEVQAQFSEPYGFHVVSDDRARLWVNGQLLVDDSAAHAATESSGLITLTAGAKYLIRLEYFQHGQAAVCKLLWSSPSTPKQIIPTSQLYSHVTDTDHDGLPDSWEEDYRLDPQDAADAFDDPDSDGLSNLEEYRAGKNPRVPDNYSLNVPFPWLARDIGNPGQFGASSFGSGTYMVTGSGWDIWGNADACHYVYQSINGEAQIVARVVAVQNTDPWAKACIMMRETLADDSRQVMISLTPEKGVSFQFRSNLAGISIDDPGGSATAPCWLKLVRYGNTFTGYRSSDGAQWEWVATEAVPMPTSIQVGLAVTSHNNQKSCTALFENVKVGYTESSVVSPRLAALTGTGDGLLGTYFNEGSQTIVSRIDPTVGFNWGRSTPTTGISADRFSVRWEGMVEAQFSEPYAFHVISDDGCRLWLDGRKVIDGWSDRAATRMTAKVPLLVGHKYLVRLEYYENLGEAVAQFQWSSPSTPRQTVPQSQLYSPTNAFYAQIEDKDRDGLPDRWERLYGLDDTDASDASTDLDGDGLTNLQEYLAGTDPRQADTDDDGLPDSWEIHNGLLATQSGDAQKDADRDGLSNLEEFQAKTNPQREDSDGDGLPDAVELRETGTNPLESDIQEITTVAEVPGAAAVATLGQWAVEGTALFAKDARGFVEYILTAPQADMYRLEVEGASQNPNDINPEFELLLSVDGEFLGRKYLRAGSEATGLVQVLMPWLNGGDHRIRIYWDNVAPYRSLRLVAVRFQSLQGMDANGNGVNDWAEHRLQTLCGIETKTGEPLSSNGTNIMLSPTSPCCLDGRGSYLSMIRITGGEAPQPAAGHHWFANVTLLPALTTTVGISFQNGGLTQATQIAWRPTDVLKARDLTIRQGDAVLFTVGREFPVADSDSLSAAMSLDIPGLTNYTGPAGTLLPCRFDQPGRYVVTGTCAPVQGAHQTGRLTVQVVSCSFDEAPAVWAGQTRTWMCRNLLPEVSLEADPRLLLEPLSFGDETSTNDTPRFNLNTDAPETRFVDARLGDHGPVLGTTAVDGFRLYAGTDVYLRVLENYEDGSQLVAMGLVLSPVRPPVSVRVQIIVGGIIFDDGTITKILHAGNFNELGQAEVRFLRPRTAQTSVCHTTTAFQGEIQLGLVP